MAIPGELAVAALVGRAFEALGLRYLVGGSLASSLHGIPRSSHDADLLAELPAERTDELVNALEDAFYVDGDMIRDAIRHGISFNVIHFDTGYKVDVFMVGDDALAQTEMVRREAHEIGDDQGPVYFASAEDILLQKLIWYRAGGESSDRQWTDVLGVLAVSGGGLDFDYLQRWATAKRVGDLLERARGSASG